ncbi:MAG: S8 family serine peptidase [Clostridiales bacterium]|nr:S8 family serine peptidase [Clostridiales bacterium]
MLNVKKSLVIVLFASILLLAAITSSAIPGSNQTGTLADAPMLESYISGQLLVGMEQPVSLSGHGANPNINLFQANLDVISITDLTDISEFVSGHGAMPLGPYEGRQILLVELDESEDLLEAIIALEEDPLVSYAELNLLGKACSVPRSSYLNDFWNYEKIEADLALNITSGSSEVLVGILDAGSNSHPALAANVDEGLGRNFLLGDNWYYESYDQIDDDYGHGVYSSGVAIGAAGNNDDGNIGVAFETSLVPLKIWDGSGIGDVAAFIQAVAYAEYAGISILNLGGGWSSNSELQAMKDAISAYSGLLVAAAGNNGNDLDDPANAFYPASFDLPNIIAVAASNQDDELCQFSNYGMAVDLVAPGENVLNASTYWHWNIDEGWYTEFGYEAWSGTSASAPHVAAAAALIKSIAPELTAAEIKMAILDNVDYCQTLDGLVLTEGRLNVYRALSSLAPLNTVTVSYDANGGSGAPSPQTAAPPFNMSSTEPTRSDYIFLGWSVNSNAEIGEYQPDEVFADNSNTTLYAVWLPDDQPIVFFDNALEYDYDWEIEEWVLSCPLTALLPANYLITVEAVVLGVEYDPNDPEHEGYYEYIEQGEFLFGSDVIGIIFPDGLAWYNELLYEITVKVYDSSSNLLASDFCSTNIIQPK